MEKIVCFSRIPKNILASFLGDFYSSKFQGGLHPDITRFTVSGSSKRCKGAVPWEVGTETPPPPPEVETPEITNELTGWTNSEMMNEDVPGDSSFDLFGMVKTWPFQGVKWPPTRGWKEESPGTYVFSY